MHCKWWDKLPINWCRISSINGTITPTNLSCHGMLQGFWILLKCFNVRDSSFSLCLGQCHHDHQVQTESEPLWNSAVIDYPCLIWRLLVDKWLQACRPNIFKTPYFVGYAFVNRSIELLSFLALKWIMTSCIWWYPFHYWKPTVDGSDFQQKNTWDGYIRYPQ